MYVCTYIKFYFFFFFIFIHLIVIIIIITITIIIIIIITGIHYKRLNYVIFLMLSNLYIIHIYKILNLINHKKIYKYRKIKFWQFILTIGKFIIKMRMINLTYFTKKNFFSSLFINITLLIIIFNNINIFIFSFCDYIIIIKKKL